MRLEHRFSIVNNIDPGQASQKEVIYYHIQGKAVIAIGLLVLLYIRRYYKFMNEL